MSGSNHLERSGESWDAAGEELRRLDPVLYEEIKQLTKAAVASHVDPLSLRKRERLPISFLRSRSRGSA